MSENTKPQSTSDMANQFTLQDIERIYGVLEHSVSCMDYTEWQSSLGWVCDEDGMRSDFNQFWQGLDENKRRETLQALGLLSAIEDTTTDHIANALDYILHEIDIVVLRREWHSAATQRRPICGKVSNKVYDLLEEYGEDHDLPENWWLEDLGDIDEAVGRCIDRYDQTYQYKYEISAVCPKYNETHTTDDADEVLGILIQALNDNCRPIKIKRNGETVLLMQC